eukprot:2252789-Amphidinium_carterae.1
MEAWPISPHDFVSLSVVNAALHSWRAEPERRHRCKLQALLPASQLNKAQMALQSVSDTDTLRTRSENCCKPKKLKQKLCKTKHVRISDYLVFQRLFANTKLCSAGLSSSS